jgi:adenosylcobinamide-phosphate synthase
VRRSILLATTYLFDHVAGDPEWFPHPVRLIGSLISNGEQVLRNPGDSKKAELLSGAVLAIGVVITTYYGAREIVRQAGRISIVSGVVAQLTLGWTCIAACNLHKEVSAVKHALAIGDIVLARNRLSRIVGRDTEILDEHEICRAVIETLAESTSDGVIAPLFYMLIGGVPLAMAYKAVNTLDSMIGHADNRYFYFGKVAARLDDLANLIPARTTAVLMISTAYLLDGFDTVSAWKIWKRDAGKHKSPNAGQPESAMAGALRARLGGSNSYAGEDVPSELLGGEFERPDLLTVDRALRLASGAWLFGALIGVVLASFCGKTIDRSE